MRGAGWGSSTLLSAVVVLAAAGCGSGGSGAAGGGGRGGGDGGTSGGACAAVAPQALGIFGAPDDAGMTNVLDIGADAGGAYFHLMLVQGGVSDRVLAQAVARRGGTATTVYQQGQSLPRAVGLYDDDAGHACALVAATGMAYTQCEGGAQSPNGLGEFADSGNGLMPQRMFAARQGGGHVFFLESRFAAISAVVADGGTYQTNELPESSVSYPGGAVSVAGFGYACVVTSGSALGIANAGQVSQRSRDGQSFRDCRIATDSARLYLAGVTANAVNYAGGIVPLDPNTGAAGPVNPTALAGADATAPLALVWFAGQPTLVQRAGDGTIASRAIGSGGTLASPRTLAGSADDWTGLAVVGPDGGLHLAFTTGGQNQYAKICP